MIKNGLRVAGVVVLVLLAGCQGEAEGEGDPLQGVVEYDDRVIAFEVGGRVLRVEVERGQALAAAAPIARLDDSLERPVRELRAAEVAAAQAQLKLLLAGARSEDLRASQAEIDAMRAKEQTLQSNAARQKQLLAAGAASAVAIETLEGELQVTAEHRQALEQRLKAMRGGARGEEIAGAQAHLQGSQAALALVDERLTRYTLQALDAGDVVDVHVKTGEMVSPGAPAVTMADLGHPFVDVFVPQGKLTGLAVGTPVQVRVDAQPKPLPGRIEHVFPKTEFTPRFLFSKGERPNLVVRVRVRIDDSQHVLHAGVPAFVRVVEKAGT